MAAADQRPDRSARTIKTGWTIGGGVEAPLTYLGLSNRWSGKFEFLYVDLGSITNSRRVEAATMA